MKSIQRHLAALMLLLSCAAAQSTGNATVQSLRTAREGSDLRVEVILNAAVIPSVETAENPDRILLDFPDTTCNQNTKNLAVNANGVRRVRTGQHSTAPMVTRVVIDLDQAHPYTMKAEGNRVILTIGAAETARHRSSQGAPVAATSGNLIGVFRKKHDSAPPSIVEDTSTPLTPPPPTTGSAFEPPTSNSTASLPAPPPSVARAPQNATASQNPPPQPSFDQNQVAAAKPEAPVASPPQPSTPESAPAVAPQPAPVVAKNEDSTAVPKTESAPASAAAQPPAKTEEAPVAVSKKEEPPAPAPAKMEEPSAAKTEEPVAVAAETSPAPADAPARTMIARSD